MSTNNEALQQLAKTVETAALESFNPMAIPGAFKGLVEDVLSAFKFTETFTEVKPIQPLEKNQLKFLKVLDQIPYSEIGELKAYVPEGMKCTYLEFLETLLPITVYLKSLQSNVIHPYCLFLGQFISDKKAGISTFSNKPYLEKLEKQREHYYKEFSKLYQSNSYNAETQVKKVIDRNADWKQILVTLNSCISNLESIDRESIKREVKQCTDYIELIVKEFSEENVDRKISQEVAHRLANEAKTVAHELEAYAITYYRALAIKGCIENTMQHIQKVFG